MQVIGHRGAAALAPENTRASFDLALTLGVDAIETDVRASADGELILMHDARLDRTTDGSGLVDQTPWQMIAGLDAGEWFGLQFRGERVPRLQDFLEQYGPLIPLVLEIKQSGIAERVLALVERSNLQSSITMTSFDFAIVEQLKAIRPMLKTGFLTADIAPASVERTRRALIDQFCPQASLVTAELVSEWKALGLEVRAWGVKDSVIMQQAIQAGVDGMTCDFPQLLLQALGRAR